LKPAWDGKHQLLLLAEATTDATRPIPNTSMFRRFHQDHDHQANYTLLTIANNTGWWFGTFFHILGITLPID